MKEKLLAGSSKTDPLEKHFATRADLATTELNLIKWYVATAFAMTSVACAITFGLTRLLATQASRPSSNSGCFRPYINR